MMLATIKTGGKQYLVSPGDKIKIEKIDEKEGSEISFSDVLLVQKPARNASPASNASRSDAGWHSDADGNKKLEIGQPKVKGAKVTAKILQQGKAQKIIVFKFKPKKRYKKKQGHRQLFTEIEILKIA